MNAHFGVDRRCWNSTHNILLMEEILHHLLYNVWNPMNHRICLNHQQYHKDIQIPSNIPVPIRFNDMVLGYFLIHDDHPNKTSTSTSFQVIFEVMTMKDGKLQVGKVAALERWHGKVLSFFLKTYFFWNKHAARFQKLSCVTCWVSTWFMVVGIQGVEFRWMTLEETSPEVDFKGRLFYLTCWNFKVLSRLSV